METKVPVTEERISHSTDQSIHACFPANISEPDSTSELDETLTQVFSPNSIPSIFPANISEPDSTSVASDETLPQVFSPNSIPSIFPPATSLTNSPANNEIIPYDPINIELCFPPSCDSDSDSFVSYDINTIHRVLRSISIQSLFPSRKSNGSEDESYPNGQILEATNLKEFKKGGEMTEVAVRLVIQNLVSLLIHIAGSLKGIHNEVASVKDELESIQAFLRDAEAKAEMNNVAKTWVKQERRDFLHLLHHTKELMESGVTKELMESGVTKELMESGVTAREKSKRLSCLL